MNAELACEFLKQLTAILERISESHENCVEVHDKLDRCTELAEAYAESNHERIENLIQVLRKLDPYLTPSERQKLVSAVNHVFKDSKGFLDAMINYK